MKNTPVRKYKSMKKHLLSNRVCSTVYSSNFKYYIILYHEIQRIISDNVILWIGLCTSNKTLLY